MPRGKPPGVSSYLRDAATPQDALSVLRAHCTVNEDGCWVWDGLVTYNGYGRVSFKNPFVGSGKWFTHRLAYYLAHGEVPTVVHHKCSTRLCCNPAHLEDVTTSQNMAEMHARRSYELRIEALEQENARLRELLGRAGIEVEERH